MSVQHLGKIEHMDIYFDPNSDNDKIIFGRKGEETTSPGFIFVPVDKKGNLDIIKEDLIDRHDPPIKEILLKQKPAKIEDYDFVIGTFSTLEPYKKAIDLIKKDDTEKRR